MKYIVLVEGRREVLIHGMRALALVCRTRT